MSVRGSVGLGCLLALAPACSAGVVELDRDALIFDRPLRAVIWGSDGLVLSIHRQTDGEPIEGARATISIGNDRHERLSDEDGFVFIEDVEADSFDVVVEKDGFGRRAWFGLPASAIALSLLPVQGVGAMPGPSEDVEIRFSFPPGFDPSNATDLALVMTIDGAPVWFRRLNGEALPSRSVMPRARGTAQLGAFVIQRAPPEAPEHARIRSWSYWPSTSRLHGADVLLGAIALDGRSFDLAEPDRRSVAFRSTDDETWLREEPEWRSSLISSEPAPVPSWRFTNDVTVAPASFASEIASMGSDAASPSLTFVVTHPDRSRGAEAVVLEEQVSYRTGAVLRPRDPPAEAGPSFAFGPPDPRATLSSVRFLSSEGAEEAIIVSSGERRSLAERLSGYSIPMAGAVVQDFSIEPIDAQDWSSVCWTAGGF